MKKLILIILLLIPISSFASVWHYENEYWKKSTYDLRIKMEQLWYTKSLSTYMINRCKRLEKYNKKIDAGHCVRIASSIWCSESSCSKVKNNNVFGFRNKSFKSQEESFDRWLKSYEKYWYKATWGQDFYGLWGKYHYCVDEHSSWTIGRCPNWLKTFNKTFNYLR